MADVRRLLWIILLVPMLSHAQGAIDAFEFENAAEAARYHALLDELRCPKCLNTNLSGSDAPIAADLRALVYRRVRAGDSDEAIRAHLQERYGDFVLYDPPVRADTIALWAVPVALLVIGLVVIARMTRAGSPKAALGGDEVERLTALLGDAAGGSAAAAGAPTTHRSTSPGSPGAERDAT